MDKLVQFIYTNGLFAMFVIIMLEYACFPVSSEIVLPLSGAVASATQIPFLMILTASVVAGTIGTSVCYAIGRFGGSPLIERIKIKFPKSNKGLNASYNKFEKFGPYAVCFGRMIPICRTYVAFIAGIHKQPLSIFLSYSILGITVWNTILIGIGYVLKSNWANAVSYYTRYRNIIIPTLLIIILLLISNKLKKKHPKNIIKKKNKK